MHQLTTEKPGKEVPKQNTQMIFMIKSSPYSGENVFAAFSAILGCIDEKVKPVVIFIFDGVNAILRNQNGQKLNNYPNIEDMYKTMITEAKFYAYDDSLNQRGLTSKNLLPGVKVIDSNELTSLLIQKGENILVF
jgi:sulfur relay (sulfurtransferase) DsrF/TusC family protein